MTENKVYHETWMNDKKIISCYLVGTFALTYMMWGIILIANNYGQLQFGTIGFSVIYGVGGLASTMMGIFLALKSKKSSSFKVIIKNIVSIIQPIKYYVVVFSLFVISMGMPILMGTLRNNKALYWGILYIFPMIFFGGLEELGWRYVFQPTVEKYVSFEISSCITAIFWALWHLPLFFMEGMSKGMNFWLFAISVFGMAFMLGAIYKISHSIWLCILFHAMINAFSQVIVDSDGVLNPYVSTIFFTAIKIIVAVVIVKLFSRKKCSVI